MAKIIENEKGFKVIKVTGIEMEAIGCGNVCDHCGKPSAFGYYVAVLNRWFCQNCYDKWYEDAVNYAEEGNADARVENRNFFKFAEALGL